MEGGLSSPDAMRDAWYAQRLASLRGLWDDEVNSDLLWGDADYDDVELGIETEGSL